MKTRPIYLDHAASTPVDPRVLRAMTPYFSKKFGNPGSLHSFGQEAIGAVDGAREQLAKAIGAEFREIIFTGSATEANNLALRGIAEAFERAHKGVAPKVIVSAIEHESILETARALKGRGFEIVYLPVDRSGAVNLRELEAALDERTALVSIMYANNEIGTIQPVAAAFDIVRNFREKKVDQFPFFHTDAAQAFQFFDCNIRALPVDLMTFSSHKLYGPKGVGVLFARGGSGAEKTLIPIITGGGQEFGLRSGTENVPLIIGLAKAVELISGSRGSEYNRIQSLRDLLFQGIKMLFPKAEHNGASEASARLPNILNIYFPGYSAEELLTKFDLAGLAASSGSACRSRAIESSYVIEALGYSKERAHASIRFSLGRPTTERDIARALKIIEGAL